MNNIIENIKIKASKNMMRIVLPESMDERVLEAAYLANNNVAKIILIGNKNEILNKNNKLKDIEIIDPKKYELTEKLIYKLYELRKEKGMSLEDATKLILNDYMYFACMLVKMGLADGVVSGACHSTSNTLRPALQIIKTHKNAELVSAFFLMDVPDCKYGDNGVFIFADSGLVQDPTSQELAEIAYFSSESFKLLTEHTPYVGMISHSSYGSAKHALVDKVKEATLLAQKKYPQLNVDGEFQVDCAIVPEVAKSKAPNSKIAGLCNVLIFPNLDCGNSAYKLVERLAKAHAYGPITQGLNAAVNDLSRGCNVNDIVGVIAITCVQAQYIKSIK